MACVLVAALLVGSRSASEFTKRNILKKFIALRGEAWLASCKEFDSSVVKSPFLRPARNPSKEVTDVGLEKEVGVAVGREVDEGLSMFLLKGLFPFLLRSLSAKECAVAVAAIAKRLASTAA